MTGSRPRRPWLRRRLALFALPALVLAAALGGPTTAGAVTYGTGVICTTYHADSETATIRFGYDNFFDTIESIAPGDDNYFAPPPPDVGQPNQFIPGNGSFDLTRAAGSPPLSWVLDGVAGEPADFAVGELPFERPCPERGPSISGLTPPDVAAGGGARSLALFGQGLAGGKVSVSGEGVSVASDGPGTEQRLDATVTVAADAVTGPRDVLVTAPNGDEVGCRGCLIVEAETPLAVGPPGPPGERGEPGPAGERGPAGQGASAGGAQPSIATGKIVHSTGAPASLGADGDATAVARCPAGSIAIAGGYALRGKGSLRSLAVVVDEARGATAWVVTVRARGAKPSRRLVASVTCQG